MITPRQLVQVGAAIQLNARIALLSVRFPKLHFTECSEDEVSPRFAPALSIDSHHLYLISGASGHCLDLTNDSEAATGILVAAKADQA